jgi:hypothetical protein
MNEWRVAFGGCDVNLRLQVVPTPDGYQATGVLCPTEPTRTYRFQSTKRPELAFRALLSEDRTEGLELARA